MDELNAILALADALYAKSKALQTSKQKSTAQLKRNIVQNPAYMHLFVQLADVALRHPDPKLKLKAIQKLFKQYGIPSFLSSFEKKGLKLFLKGGNLWPRFAVFLFEKAFKAGLSGVLLQSKHLLVQHCKLRKKQGFQSIVNSLGESVYSEGQVKVQMEAYLWALAQPDIEHLAVKLSSIVVNPSDIDDELYINEAKQPLIQLFELAVINNKIITFDMEECKDLERTVNLLMNVLDEPRFFSLKVGVALQAYLPISIQIQKQITDWASQRKLKGALPFHIRLVKGANKGTESIQSSHLGWSPVIFAQKQDTDTQFKRMFLYSLNHLESVHIRVASHNVFDIAFALFHRNKLENPKAIGFEMLEGMSEEISQAVLAQTSDVSLYCPVVIQGQFKASMAYLLRRLDENSAPKHFLKLALNLDDSAEWEQQKNNFIQSYAALDKEMAQVELNEPSLEFKNQAVEDLRFAQNRKKIKQVIGEVSEGVKVALTPLEGIDQAFETAKQALSLEPIDVLQISRVWVERAIHYKTQLIQQMMNEVSKPWIEAEHEWAEAIDYVNFYAAEFLKQTQHPGVYTPLGVVAVIPPWNFPLSIATGCIAAALFTGNSVLFKPAPEAIEVGYWVAKLFWEAGVPKEKLQFVACEEEPVGRYLIAHPALQAVMLTGSDKTAALFYTINPNVRLIAETGGKNTLIVTPWADIDLAVQSVIKSAFGYSGQKCSAASLLILTGNSAFCDDFLTRLKEATLELKIGHVTDTQTDLGHLVQPIQGPLKQVLEHNESGEYWVLEPKQNLQNPRFLTPGIKANIKPGSFLHQTELFGPVLGVMFAYSLSQAIQWANATPYGLTAGLESLSTEEQWIWQTRIQAGNLYINRPITGAVVGRQPFGGVKSSQWGNGYKAGGPLYLRALQQLTEAKEAKVKVFPQSILQSAEVHHLIKPKTVASVQLSQKPLWVSQAFEIEFNGALITGQLPDRFVQLYDGLQGLLSEHEKTQLQIAMCLYTHEVSTFTKGQVLMPHVVGEKNTWFCIPLESMGYRFEPSHSLLQVALIALGAWTALTPLIISSAKDHPALSVITRIAGAHIECVFEPENDWHERIALKQFSRIRVLESPSITLLNICHRSNTRIEEGVPYINGTFELPRYMQERTLSQTTHRYGYLPH